MAVTANDIEEKIIRARVRMLLKVPFFGTLATRLILKDGSGWIPTAATDGRHLYYNVEFFNKLDKKELEFVVAHEVMHAVYDHMARRGSRDPRLWNCAADYIINYELCEQKIGRLPTTVKCLYDIKYKDMCSEEVYELLKEEDNKGKGDKEADSFDTHLDPNADKNGSGSGEGKEGGEDPTGYNGRIPMSEEEREKLKDEITQATMQAAKAAGAGKCPAGVRRLISDLTEPQMDWREILNCHIQSSVKYDYTFSKMSRKAWGTNVRLPGMNVEDKLEVYIALDTSGSISSSMLRDFLGEVKGIMEQFTDFTVKIWTFDTQVHNPQDFTPDNIEELLDYDIQGGGGTDFDVNYEFMKESDIVPHRFIMMTDGYPWNSWGDEDFCDTIFLIHGNNTIVAPFGTTCYYEEPGR